MLGLGMELRPQHAWFAFGLAALCICVAVAYAVYENRRPATATAPPEPPAMFPLPAVRLPRPVQPAPPAAPAPKAPSPGTPPTAQLVQVYPGGWVWNPEWHDYYYWDHRWGDHRRPRRWREMDKWIYDDMPWKDPERRK